VVPAERATTREKGEAHSIRQMMERAAIDFSAGRSRFFISGAILPYGCAASVQEVFEAMFNVSSMPSRAFSDRVHGASIVKGNTLCEIC
jgi:poly(3-hydroxybutyrate) depolymerase